MIKFKIHIENTAESIFNSATPISEKSHIATPPRITTSKSKNEGTIETKKYITKM